MENNYGSDRAIRYLEKQLRNEEYVGSMLFVGKNETEKFEKAMSFARSVLCLNKSLPACEICSDCRLSSKMTHPDLLVIDNQESIKIEEIRKVRNYLMLKPYRAKHKIVVINRADRMTQEGSNAFLKVLEEPLKDSIIILIAPETDRLIETIVSRTQVINFGSVNLWAPYSDTLEYDLQNPSIEKFFQIAEKNLSLHDALLLLEQVELNFRKKFLLSIGDPDNEGENISFLEHISAARNYLRANITPKNVLENMFINLT